MATITRFKEPLKFQPLQYRGLDRLEVFIEDGSADSFDYFGLTRIPRELTAGRNLISFTGTRNLVPGSEIAIEVLDANGETIPIQTYDYIGEGNERIFAIEIGSEVPEGDALITLIGVAKGEVGFDAQRQRDASRLPPPRFRGVFNVRWQKRLNCYPRRRNSDEIVYFKNPDITIEEIKRPYFKLHYNTELSASNSRSLFTLCSTGSEGSVNTTAKVSYQVAANKYYLVADANPDFGGFTQDMVGGTIYVPNPVNPFPARFDGPTGTPSYNQLETGDGTGEIDENTQQYTKQGAYNTIISELISPLRVRVNSPHTTFQGFGRANQKEVFHQRFDDSDFRLDFAQAPISRSNPLVSGSNNFATSYAKVTFNGLTPLVGDVTRIKTFIKNDQTVTDYFLVGDNPVEPPNLLIQSSSQVERLPAGDFSPFGVSGSLNEYWSASATPGLSPSFGNDNLSIFRQLVGNVNNPIPDSLQVGNSILAHSVGQLDGTEHILIDSNIPILHEAGKYYQVEFKTFGQKVNSFTPSIKVYMYGDAINDEGDDLGQMIGQITDIDNQELVIDEDPFDEYKTTSLKFVYKADATEFGYLRFKIEQGLWFLFDVTVRPYYQYGYTPHFFDVIIPTTKANVGQVDALDFKFEFYNDAHNKALYVADIKNIEFDNEFTFTATNAFFTSASIGTFIGATPMGDNDWVKPFLLQGAEAQFQPSLTGSIYHSGSVGIGNFLSTTVDFPLHINKLQDEGNATIKLSSFSSSVIHLASDAGGAGIPNERNALILFDHQNAATSSVIGYTDIADKDPGGATFDGAPAGSFTIHERHARSIAMGVGGIASLIIAQDGKPDTSPRAVYIGYDDVETGPFSPDQFGYELNISGSIMVSSGTMHYPNPPGATSTDSDIVFLSYNTPHPPLSNDRGRLVSRSFRESAAVLGLGADTDWHIKPTFITQSRTIGGEGRTVFIGDGAALDEAGSSTVLTTHHILQISQSGTSPASKIRFEGLNDLGGSTSNNVLILDENGDLYITGSYGVGGSGGAADNLGDHTATQDLDMGGFSINNVESITVTSITSSHITSSTINTTGSTIFGHAADDTHEFIGGITGSHSLNVAEDIRAGRNLAVIGDATIGDDIFLNSAGARLRFSGANTNAALGGIMYDDSGGGNRLAFVMERTNDIVAVTNRAANGTVQIRANNGDSGATGESVVAEFSQSEAKFQTKVSMSNNLNIEGEKFQTHQSYVFLAPPSQNISSLNLMAGNFANVITGPHGIDGQFAYDFTEGYTMPYNGSITAMAVSYAMYDMFFQPSINGGARLTVSASVYRTGSHPTVDSTKEIVIKPGPFGTDAIANLKSFISGASPHPHESFGLMGSYTGLIKDIGPKLPHDVFGNDGNQDYSGKVRYKRTYAKGENPFLAGDVLNIHYYRAADNGVAENLQNSFGLGDLLNFRVELEVAFDRSGSYGNFYGGNEYGF